MATSVLAVKIDKSLNLGKTLAASAAGFWFLNWDNASMITTVVAISHQKIVGVFSVSNPYKVASGKNKGRIGFHFVTALPTSAWTPYLLMQPFTFPSAVKYI